MDQPQFILNRNSQSISDKAKSNINYDNLSSIYNIFPLNGLTNQIIPNQIDYNKLMIKPPKLPSYRKAMWTEVEDQLLLAAVKQHGTHNWGIVAASVAGRTRKQCRERWSGKLNPDLVKEPWTEEEDIKLKRLHEKFGNKWALISVHLAGRSPIMLKNRWGFILRHSNQSKKSVKHNDSSTLNQPKIQSNNHDIDQVKSSEKNPNDANDQNTSSTCNNLSNTIIPTFCINNQSKINSLNTSNNSLPFSLGNQPNNFNLQHFP